jgi:hypothetical protein
MTAAAGWLAALLALVHLAPQHLARALGHSHAAWEYVLYATEAAVLWLIVGAGVHMVALKAAAAWGATEGGMRALCRVALPMDRPPSLPPGSNLCDVATGLPASWFSLAAALLVACIAQEEAARHVAQQAAR